MATVSSAPPVDVKAAARIAAQYFDQLLQHPYSDLAVEEIELSEDRRTWQVTLGYVLTDPGMPAFMTKSPREFKVITVDAQSGEPTSMKIKKL
jgi:hypothetical protein